MMRLLLGSTAVVVAGGAMAATGGTIEASHSVLSPPVAEGTAGVRVDDAPDHAAVVHVPPGAPLLAVSSGAVLVIAPAHITVHGSGDDAGLDVDYTQLPRALAVASVQRGETLSSAVSTPMVVTIRAVLDGRALDTAALLRHALDGGGAASLGGWTRPVDGAFVSQPFGCTPYAMEPVDRACPSGHTHTGIDLAVAAGTPVHAALDGIAHVVVSATGFGLHVILDHGDGLTTLYGHLESVLVMDGDVVSAGDVIGLAGSTGNSTGPHLHFEVRRDGIAEDPTLDVALP